MSTSLHIRKKETLYTSQVLKEKFAFLFMRLNQLRETRINERGAALTKNIGN